MGFRIKKKQKYSICRICGETYEDDTWFFPIIWDICRYCTIDGITWASKKALKEREK